MTIRPGNAQHQGARDYQEDSFAFSDVEDAAFAAHAGVLAVVADGMGGLAHGGQAGAVAVRTFLQRYEAKFPDESIPHALGAALQAANAAVLDLARDSGDVGNVGATLVAAVVHDQRLHWISVGDSRAYLQRNSELTQLTIDHVYAAELDEKVAAGTLSREQAENDPDREALTSHLGRIRLTTIDCSVEPLPLDPGDRVLLCSDGLYRALAEDEIALALTGDPQAACERLVDGAVKKALAGQDNLTAIALAIDDPTATVVLPAGREHEEPAAARQRRVLVPLLSLLAIVALLAIAGVVWRRLHRANVPGGGAPDERHATTTASPAGRGGTDATPADPPPADQIRRGSPAPGPRQ